MPMTTAFPRHQQTFAWVMRLCVLGVAHAAFAATVIEVNDSGDAGPDNCSSTCTLRDAIRVAAADDIIQFSPSILPATITLDPIKGELSIYDSLNIIGPGPDLVTISAQSQSRVLAIQPFPSAQSALDVYIYGLTLRDGRITGTDQTPASSGQDGQPGEAVRGGCILAANVYLKLERTVVRNCVAQGGRGGDGGSGTTGNGGVGGQGGVAAGGAIAFYVVPTWGGSLDLIETSVIDAQAHGGAGGRGGTAGTGGAAVGGMGGGGGPGYAGAIVEDGLIAVSLVNSTIGRGAAIGGNGGSGGNGNKSSGNGGGNGGVAGKGLGGLVSMNSPGASLVFTTLAEGDAHSGSPGTGGSGTPSGSPGFVLASMGAAIETEANLFLISTAVVGVSATPLCHGSVMESSASLAETGDISCAASLHGTLASQFLAFDPAVTVPIYRPRHDSDIRDGAASCIYDYQGIIKDELGISRPQDGACDIGAIETDYIFVGGFEVLH